MRSTIARRDPVNAWFQLAIGKTQPRETVIDNDSRY